ADVVGVTTRSAAKKEQAQTTADQSETETEEETDDTDNRKPLERESITDRVLPHHPICVGFSSSTYPQPFLHP
ncbi:unnamed protein product, partial [Didymodactylos carnosus]